MNGLYLTIAGRIRRELQDLQQLVDRTIAIWQAGLSSGNDYYIDAVALNLHGFYVEVERLLELIADSVDQAKPGGANWHQQLLRQMSTDIVSIRPMVLRQETVSYLDKYRGFRHVVRNVYTFNLDPQQIALLIEQLPSAIDYTIEDLLGFAQFLEQTGSRSDRAF